MSEKDIKRLLSVIATTNYCETAASIAATAGIANFAPAVALVKGKVVIVQNYKLIGDNNTSGVTTNLKAIRASMMQHTYLLGNSLFSFAASCTPPDYILMAQAKLSESSLEDATKENCVTKCTAIQQLAADNAAAIAPYGASATDITDTGSLITLYMAGIEDPRGAAITKNNATKQAVNTLNEVIDTNLTLQLDTMANTLRYTNSEWWTGYRSAREIIDPGTFDTTLKILVLNQANNQPLKNVKSYRNGSVSYKKSSDLGYITYKDIEEGSHNFVLKHKSFQDLLVPDVMIAHNNKYSITASMTPLSGGGSAGITIIREDNITSPGIVNIDIADVQGTPSSEVTIEVTSAAGVRFYASPNPGDTPGTEFYDKETGTVTMLLDQFKSIIGYSATNQYLNAQNIGMTTAHFKLTFTGLETP